MPHHPEFNESCNIDHKSYSQFGAIILSAEIIEREEKLSEIFDVLKPDFLYAAVEVQDSHGQWPDEFKKQKDVKELANLKVS